uniref:Uncharacterized protein n=1 Tax=Lepeophtheirus salmonis TaxID=72036 RepID=A0A0K2VJ42_LEPSM
MNNNVSTRGVIDCIQIKVLRMNLYSKKRIESVCNRGRVIFINKAQSTSLFSSSYYELHHSQDYFLPPFFFLK